MRCPRCKRLHDILRYEPLELIEEFVAETTYIYKCPGCRWLFAPVDMGQQPILETQDAA